MKWCYKYAQSPLKSNLRYSMPSGGSPVTCPVCSNYIWEEQKLEKCPTCERSTRDLDRWQRECPDCGTEVRTGKIANCPSCGFDWTTKSVSLNNNVWDLFYPQKGTTDGYISQLISDLNMKTVQDLITTPYSTFKEKIKEYFLEEVEKFNYPTKLKWPSYVRYSMQTLLDIGQNNFLSLDPKILQWIDYLKKEMELDEDILQIKATEDQEREDYYQKLEQEQNEQEQKAKVLGKALYKIKDRMEGWEDVDIEEAMNIARNFITSSPLQRGQFRKEIQEIAQNLFGRKEMSTRQYFMEPEEAYQYIESIKEKNLKEIATEKLIDIISKTVGITGNKNFGDPTYIEEEVHPGAGMYVLGPAGVLKVEAMNELFRRIKENQNDQMKLKEIHDALDEDLRSIFFRKKTASWVHRASSLDLPEEAYHGTRTEFAKDIRTQGFQVSPSGGGQRGLQGVWLTLDTDTAEIYANATREGETGEAIILSVGIKPGLKIANMISHESIVDDFKFVGLDLWDKKDQSLISDLQPFALTKLLQERGYDGAWIADTLGRENKLELVIFDPKNLYIKGTK